MRAVAALIAAILILSACADDAAPRPPTPGPSTPTSAPAPTASPAPTATPQPTPTPAPTSTPQPTPTFAPTPVILPTVEVVLETPTPTAPFPAELDRTLDAISIKTSVIRGLTSGDSIERRLISSDELRQIIQDDFLEDEEELAVADRLYKLLGVIEPEAAVRDILLGVFQNVVAGFFDTDESALTVVTGSEEFTLSNELTVAHEVTHSLQQEHFNIRDIRDGTEHNSDRRRAITALIEGDATLAELIYRLKHFDEQQQQRLQDETSQQDFSAFRAAPPLIQRTVAFPYVDGANFAITLFQMSGDFSLIDQVYGTLPESTEQIIHPELYGQDSPVEITMPDLPALLGEGWTEIDRNVMGELFLGALLQGALAPGVAGSAAAGWGGDAYLLLEDPQGNEAIVAVSAWDTIEDAEDFFSALLEYFRTITSGQWIEEDAGAEASIFRTTSDQSAIKLRSQGGAVWLTIAADSQTVDTLISAALENTEVPILIAPAP